MAKRAFDVAVAGVFLAVASPVMAICAVLIKLSSPGPVIYRAARAGLYGREFAMFKFRTMRTGVDHPDHRVTEVHDPRITKVGAALRKTKLDELPQLLNVMKGDMSIVGPRPEDIGIVRDHYTERHMRTLDVRPGISSFAELRWYPDLTYHDPPPPEVSTQDWYIRRHMPAELEESLRYIDEQSLRLDLKVIARTAWNIVRYAFVDPEVRPLLAGPPDERGGHSTEVAI